MKVPAQVKNYEANIQKSKEKLTRLNKGSRMLDEALKSNDVLECLKIIRLWNKLSREVFAHLETATLIHQQLLTNKSVLVKSNGELVKSEDMMDTNVIEIDPFTLSSIKELAAVFGDDYKNMLEIQ